SLVVSNEMFPTYNFFAMKIASIPGQIGPIKWFAGPNSGRGHDQERTISCQFVRFEMSRDTINNRTTRAVPLRQHQLDCLGGCEGKLRV
ncbi:MAG TPA: hypothetical protein VLM40_09815, partial [Gemmata sp.]|nr:hypothetical protein [Gemmata sp.]